MNTEIIITGAVGAFTTIVGSWTSWFFARKRANADTNSVEIDNLSKALEFYQSIAEDNNKKLAYYINLAEANRIEMHRLRTLVSSLVDNACLDPICTKRKAFSEEKLKEILTSKELNDELKA